MPRLSLRPSAALLVALGAGIGGATAAIQTTLAPWLGTARALPLTLAFLAACCLTAAAWRRSQPAIIQIGPDSIVALTHDGKRLYDARLTGAAQWGGSLLSLAMRPGGGRQALLVAADALTPAAFRALAVRARCAAGR